eukprot:530494_1
MAAQNFRNRNKYYHDAMYYFPSSITKSYLTYTKKDGDYRTCIPIGQFGKIESSINICEPSRLQPQKTPNKKTLSNRKHKKNRTRRGAIELNVDLTDITNRQSNCKNRFVLGNKIAKIGGNWIHRGIDIMFGNIILIETVKMDKGEKCDVPCEHDKYVKLLYKQRELIEPQYKYPSKIKLVCQWKDKNMIYKVIDFKGKNNKNSKKRRGAAPHTVISMTLPLNYDGCEIGV